MKAALLIAVAVAVVACSAFLILPDDAQEPVGTELDAGYSVTVDYNPDGATLVLSPKCKGLHTWTVEHDGTETTTDTRDGEIARITVPISDTAATVTHTVTDGEASESMSSPITRDGRKNVTLDWSGGRINLVMDYPTFQDYRDRGTMSYSVGVIAEWTDPIATRISDYLSGVCEGMSNDEKARALLRFVQDSIVYESDMQSTGREEWFKSVYETVYDGAGDCEDTAIMFTSIGRLMGLDIVMIDFVGHIGAAVVMDSCSGQSWSYDGKMYYYCETAVDNSNPAIGEDPIGAEFLGIII